MIKRQREEVAEREEEYEERERESVAVFHASHISLCFNMKQAAYLQFMF